MRVPLSPVWIGLAVVLPLVVGALVAYPLWRRRVTDEMGSVAGAGVVLLCAVAFIAREYGEVLVATGRCVDAGVGCRFEPQPFLRYAIYAAIGMCQVFVLFGLGLSIEERVRRRETE